MVNWFLLSSLISEGNHLLIYNDEIKDQKYTFLNLMFSCWLPKFVHIIEYHSSKVLHLAL